MMMKTSDTQKIMMRMILQKNFGRNMLMRSDGNRGDLFNRSEVVFPNMD